MAQEKACRNCRFISMSKDVCPNCGSNDTTENWIGFVIITDAERSQLSATLDIKTNGRYAIKIK